MMLQQPEVLQLLAAPTRSAAATCRKFAYMTLKLKYEKLESDDLLQIAANLANFFSLGSTVFRQIEKRTFSFTDTNLFMNYNNKAGLLCAVRQRQKAPLWVGGG